MKVLGRGHTEFTEVPDNPPPATATTVARGDADAHVTSDHSMSSVTSADPLIPAATMPASAAAIFSAFAHADAPIQWFAQGDAPAHWFADAFPSFVPVASAVTDLQGMSVGRGDVGLGGTGGSGSGEIARGSDGLLAMSLSDYPDHGWFIVPSAANEYGQAYAAGDEFVWDVAAGEFSADWFFV